MVGLGRKRPLPLRDGVVKRAARRLMGDSVDEQPDQAGATDAEDDRKHESAHVLKG
jgi:hypothetical protein